MTPAHSKCLVTDRMKECLKGDMDSSSYLFTASLDMGEICLDFSGVKMMEEGEFGRSKVLYAVLKDGQAQLLWDYRGILYQLAIAA